VAINRLLDALDGPGEVRATIPAAVFGGDIFGVMSSQLREALVVPPATSSVISQPRRKQSLFSNTNSSAKHPQNDFPALAARLTPSTPFASTPTTLHRNSERSSLESPAFGAYSITENLIEQQPLAHALVPSATRFDELSDVVQQQPIDSTTSPAARLAQTARLAPAAPALVNSLNRYWQAVREARDTRDSRSQPETEFPANAVSFPGEDSEQRIAPRAWPTSVGRDVSQKLRSFVDVNVPLKSRLSSAPQGQIQNPFNIEVNQASHQSPTFDDFGDRLAQVLHEQALQHGIDVT
jgi:hypothetical protein